MIEIRLIPEFEDYFICSNGEVYHINYNNTNKIGKLTPCKNRDGYLFVRLSKKGNVKNRTIHRLIAQHFIPNNSNKNVVNHLNGIKADNRIENLEWCTRSENDKHAFKLGLRKPLRANAKITKEIAKEINKRANNGERGIDLSKEYKLSNATISMIKNNQIWQ